MTLFCTPDLIQAKNFDARLWGENLPKEEVEEGSLAYPSYLGRNNISYIPLQNLANRINEKELTRQAFSMAGLPFQPGQLSSSLPASQFKLIKAKQSELQLLPRAKG